MDNLCKFNTIDEYNDSKLKYPNVSLITSTNTVIYKRIPSEISTSNSSTTEFDAIVNGKLSDTENINAINGGDSKSI